MNVTLSPSRLADYMTFLKIVRLPTSKFTGRTVEFPDEYANLIGARSMPSVSSYEPPAWMFDYQRDISKLAIQKRKFCVFADCGLGKTAIVLEFAKHCQRLGLKVLVVSPLMVIPQTIGECVRFYGHEISLEHVRAKDLDEWMELPGSPIGITNYEALHDGTPSGNIGALILDECFAPGTMIEIIDGNGDLRTKGIENLLPGDSIRNVDGMDTVVAVKRREIDYAVAITAGTKITCSPNHPFFTQRGWVCAQDLEPGDSVLKTEAAMRMVHGDILPDGHLGAYSFLRSILLSEMEDETAGTHQESSQPAGGSQAGQSQSGLVCIRESEGTQGNRTDSEPESHERPGGKGEGVAYFKGQEARTFRAWGQRTWLDRPSEDYFGCVRKGLEGGICFITGPTTARVSDALQARFSRQRSESVYRSGWGLAPFAETLGRKEGCDANWVRVESLEVLEQGHPGLERFRQADGKLYFYDIEAKRHPSYSVGGLLVHNSSMLKSHYGKWGATCLRLGRGLEWKLACTGTPAPNDRIEYANHAVFMDAFPTVNAFLARFFVNRGQTQNRWELKRHALEPFYRHLSHWAIFLSNPATYGWKDNSTTIPPIHVHIENVPLTKEQNGLVTDKTGTLFAHHVGGITSRSFLGQVAKGSHKGKDVGTLKPGFIRDMVAGWPDESTIIWCLYNREQESIAAQFPDAGNIKGDTPNKDRLDIIDNFKSGKTRILISKPRILGFGLNLQVATRQVFSGLQDSYESYYQAVKRSNRVGSTRPLNVHIPVTSIEMPMVQTVLDKAHRVHEDTLAQEKMFNAFRA